MFSDIERKEHIERCMSFAKNVDVIISDEFTADIVNKLNVTHLIRGLRNGNDLEYERPIRYVNDSYNIDTIYFMTDEKTSIISSSLVRELIKYNKPIYDLVQHSDQLLKIS